MDRVEDEHRCCVLECDGPGHLDARVRKENGLALVVVRSYSAVVRARDIGAAAITNFDQAASAAEGAFSGGAYVVSDKAVKFVARLLPAPPALVVLEGVESLRLPNCPDLGAGTVWMTRFSPRERPAHRGWATECFEEAVRNDAVIRRRGGHGRRYGVPVKRELYYDFPDDESYAVVAALDAGDEELAVRAFPGRFEAAPSAPTGVCPICYEEPRPRVTAACCGRDFCLSCAARSMGDSSSCPWCRRPTGLWNCRMEPGAGSHAPFKDALVTDVVRRYLDQDPGNTVLVVTSDDVYTYNVRTNPIAVFRPCAVGGSAAAVGAAVGALSRGPGEDRRRVGVAWAPSMLCRGMGFPGITHVVFTERESFREGAMASWLAACPDAVQAVAMTSVIDAAADAAERP